jgi:hypothetical protein
MALASQNLWGWLMKPVEGKGGHLGAVLDFLFTILTWQTE